MRNAILASGYFSGKEQEKKLRYFEKLDEALRRDRHRLFLVNHGPDQLKSRCDSVTVPEFIMTAHKVDGSQYLAEGDLTPGLRKAAGVEAAVRGCSILNAAVKALYFRAFAREVLQRAQPSVCVLWHQFNTPHHAFAQLCVETGMPYLYAEYGVLPGTTVFEHGGQMAESWVVRENDRFLALPVDEVDLRRAREFLDLVRKERRTRKDQASEVDLEELIEQSRRSGKKVVFYAGQNDYNAGILPDWLPEARLHSPFFRDTYDALQCLTRLAHEDNWQILFKPHPILAARRKAIKVDHPERMDVVTGANIFDCMGKSDVTTTILSQVSYQALIDRRPCVLLGRNQLSGKGCLYETSSLEAVGGAFQDALANGFTADQEAAFHRHAAQLLKHYLFAMDDDLVKLIGRDVNDAARFLVQSARVPDASPPAERRGEAEDDKQGFLHLLKLRMAYRFNMLKESPWRGGASGSGAPGKVEGIER